jgi:hypothetical protein
MTNTGTIGRGTVPGPDGEIPYLYVLDVDLTPQPANLDEAMALFDDLDRRTVENTSAASPDGVSYRVLTIFLVFDDDAAVLDFDSGGPWLWGTAIQREGCALRPVAEYRTVTDAVEGHRDVVSMVRAGDLRLTYDSRRRRPAAR